jgi:hypothetical protein
MGSGYDISLCHPLDPLLEKKPAERKINKLQLTYAPASTYITPVETPL